MPIVVVTGSPGAGKTSILAEMKDYNGIKTINFGNMLVEYAKQKGYIKEKDPVKAHDELRFLEKDPKIMEELQKYAFGAIGKMKGNILLDTHASIQAGKRYMPGLPNKYVELLANVVGFIYIDVDTDTVIKRRLADKTRARREIDAAEIDAQRIVNLSELSYLSAFLGVPLYIIENEQGKLQDSIAHVKRAASELFKV